MLATRQATARLSSNISEAFCLDTVPSRDGEMLFFSKSCQLRTAKYSLLTRRRRWLFRQHALENVVGEQLPLHIGGLFPWPVFFVFCTSHIVGDVAGSFDGGLRNSRFGCGGTAIAKAAVFGLDGRDGVVPVQ